MFYQFSVYHVTVLRVGAVTNQIVKESTCQKFVKNMRFCNSMAQMSLSLYTVFGIMDMELCINKQLMTIK